MTLPSLPKIDVPHNVSFSALHLRKLQEYGDQVAIVEDATGRKMTYAEFITTVKRLGAALLRQGVQRGDVVSICTLNCMEHILLFYALSRIGAVFSGVNALFPEDDIIYQISNSDTRFVVTSTSALPKIQSVLRSYSGIKKVFLVGEEMKEGIPTLFSLLTDEECDDISDDNPDFDARLTPFTLLYTSGTTGIPKAVIQPQYTFSYGTFSLNDEKFLVAKPGDVTVVMLPFFHAFAQMAIMNHLMYNATKLVLIPNGLDFANYVRTIEKYQARTLWTNPPVVIKLATDTAVVSKHNLSCVRALVYAGAPVREPVVKRLRERLSSITFLGQCLGMSESGITAMCTSGIAQNKPISCGILTPGNEGKIIDSKTGDELGANKKGELLLKTVGEMLYYFKDPSKTKATIDEEGWLHTGDVAYFDEDGCLYVTDRIKDVIKFKEGKIFPSDVDTLVLQHPEVDDVATIAAARPGLGEVPYIFLVCCQGRNIDEEILKESLKKSTILGPDVPVEVEFVEQIPRNPAGKLLMAQLRQWADDKTVPRKAFTALTLKTT